MRRFVQHGPIAAILAFDYLARLARAIEGKSDARSR